MNDAVGARLQRAPKYDIADGREGRRDAPRRGAMFV